MIYHNIQEKKTTTIYGTLQSKYFSELISECNRLKKIWLCPLSQRIFLKYFPTNIHTIRCSRVFFV